MNALLYKFFLSPLRKVYLTIFRPKTRGVKVIIQHKNEILLIKNTYGPTAKKWTLPGGGVKKKEALTEAAKREIREELGLKLNNLRKLGSFLNTAEHKKDTATVFFSRVENKNIRPSKKEIKQVAWFDRKDLQSLEDKFFTLEESLKLLKNP